MTVMHNLHAPVWIFIAFSLFWTCIAFFAASLYDKGTNVAKRLGQKKLVAFRERLRPKVIPPAKAALFIMSCISLIFAILRFFG